jgi:hypothetical protein
MHRSMVCIFSSYPNLYIGHKLIDLCKFVGTIKRSLVFFKRPLGALSFREGEKPVDIHQCFNCI